MENATIHAPDEVHLVLSKEELEIIKDALGHFLFYITQTHERAKQVESIISKL